MCYELFIMMLGRHRSTNQLYNKWPNSRIPVTSGPCRAEKSLKPLRNEINKGPTKLDQPSLERSHDQCRRRRQSGPSLLPSVCPLIHLFRRDFPPLLLQSSSHSPLHFHFFAACPATPAALSGGRKAGRGSNGDTGVVAPLDPSPQPALPTDRHGVDTAAAAMP